MGYNEYNDDHILNVCKIAGVDDFVKAHPQGYDLEIREKGDGLSGGQKQAINLARSLLHDPAILLLMNQQALWIRQLKKKLLVSKINWRNKRC